MAGLRVVPRNALAWPLACENALIALGLNLLLLLDDRLRPFSRRYLLFLFLRQP